MKLSKYKVEHLNMFLIIVDYAQHLGTGDLVLQKHEELQSQPGYLGQGQICLQGALVQN